MNLEIKDINELDIIAEGLGRLSRENDFSVSIFKNIKNREHATEEEHDAYMELIAKRKRIDQLINRTNKLMAENRRWS